MGAVFPHRAKTVKAMRATPGGDRLLLELASAAATHAAKGAPCRPVLLALSLSSNDYINHVLGPDSWEARDELRRLDRGLADLFAVLDSLVGPTGYAVMLTGDHGSNPLPEVSRTGKAPWCRRGAGAVGADYWQRPCGHAARLMSDDILRQLEADAPGLVAAIVDPFVYLTPLGQALPPAERAGLKRKIEAQFAGSGDIALVVDTRAVPESCPPASDDTLAALVCRSIRRDQPGDFYLVPAPGTFFDPDLTAGRGTNHGSPYLYDRTVPLVVRAPGRVPAGATRTVPTSYGAFARTAASLLGIREPTALSGSDAPDLTSSPQSLDVNGQKLHE